MSNNNIGLVSAILTSKCPKCRHDFIYEHHSVFPLKTTLRTIEKCRSCGQRLKFSGDYAPGMNYAVSVIVYIFGFIMYGAIWGIRMIDNSIVYAFLFSTALVILLQPWIMRISKNIYLYLFIRFKGE